MGVVYKAWQARLKRLVALKLLRGDLPDEEARARFRAEYEILARLRHPNIVQIYEAGERNGLPFFSLEMIAKVNANPNKKFRWPTPKHTDGAVYDY
jgi:serine/threonine-protein kinase